jgi:glycosyltransferase involved in cell wall biosynthesis
VASRRPSLSVVITTYTKDRLPDVLDVLGSLKAQTCSPAEIVFVAEGDRGLCTTVSGYAREQGLHNVVIVFNEGERGLSAARNLGAQQARGEIIAFVDDDVVLSPHWAEEVVKAFADDSVIGVTGPAYPLWEDPGMSWFPEELDWLISCTRWNGWNQVREVRNGWGMNMSFRKSALDLAGGFRSEFGLHNNARSSWYDPPSEDVDLSIRVRRLTGGRILYNPGVKIHAKVSRRRLTIRYIMQRSFSVGYQRRRILELYPEEGEGTRALAQEHALRDRILRRLVPRIIKGIFIQPSVAWRQLPITLVSLSFVLLGYYAPLLLPRMRGPRPQPRRPA